MFAVDRIILLTGALLLIGILSSKISMRMGLPVLILFLLVGMLAGNEGIGRIDFDKYGGRVVANAATRATPDISEALLKTGLVRPYDGGRRESWCGR